MRPDEAFPFFGIEIRTPRLSLRLGGDEDNLALARVAASGIYPAGRIPFVSTWAEEDPDVLPRNLLQHRWGNLSGQRPGDWNLHFTVFHEGGPVGVQSLWAKDFGVRRTVNSGSWLGRDFQGRGLGTEMRAAVLELGFATLGAELAHSGSFRGNAASEAVSRKLGYEPNGIEVYAVKGERKISQNWLLRREAWERSRREVISVSGVTPACLEFFGLTP
ncbi:GNAT family N-acetyltransferase [Salininema proteolyticum]|uniref:GNAT family N-acetyltransferase n=1 Tax=Salininema proteolyticum TaxID=1607685 RepID=A0ABV8U491_9ACTN